MIASAVFLFVAVAGTMFYLRAYRPTRAPVVEQARTPQDVRAKVSTGAKLRLRRHAARNNAPASPSLMAKTPDSTGPTGPSAEPAPAGPAATFAPHVALHASTSGHPLVQATLGHNVAGAPAPGSYFRNVEAPSPETILSDVRGPWAAQIVAADGRISLPDNGMDVPVAWATPEETPPAGSYLS